MLMRFNMSCLSLSLSLSLSRFRLSLSLSLSIGIVIYPTGVFYDASEQRYGEWLMKLYSVAFRATELKQIFIMELVKRA